jgi:hypothetical protein
MSCRNLLLLLLLLSLSTAPARAGIIFNRKPRPTPAERVPQLLTQLKEDGDENKRGAAAEELRNYDSSTFPAMVPALIDALLNDRKPYVRAEAAQTLGKLRPMQPSIAAALEKARDKDESMRVRLQARTSLMAYQWSGFRGPIKEEPTPTPKHPSTKEPPLADPIAPPPNRPAPAPVVPPAPVKTEIPPEPTSQPAQVPVISTGNAARPLPPGPSSPPAREEKGPELPPPD